MTYMQLRSLFSGMKDDEIRQAVRVAMQVLNDRRGIKNESLIAMFQAGQSVEYVDSQGWVWRGRIVKINCKTVAVRIKSAGDDLGYANIRNIEPSKIKIISDEEFAGKPPMDLPVSSEHGEGATP